MDSGDSRYETVDLDAEKKSDVVQRGSFNRRSNLIPLHPKMLAERIEVVLHTRGCDLARARMLYRRHAGLVVADDSNGNQEEVYPYQAMTSSAVAGRFDCHCRHAHRKPCVLHSFRGLAMETGSPLPTSWHRQTSLMLVMLLVPRDVHVES
jgi:hypothetical protein